MTTIVKQTFYCKYCDHSWYRKYDIEQHYKTKKHTKNEKKGLENEKKSLENEKRPRVVLFTMFKGVKYTPYII